jgi:hypothetical protein
MPERRWPSSCGTKDSARSPQTTRQSRFAGDAAIGSLHRRLIAGLGMPLGELWDLDELAATCAAAGRYECCVVSVPLNVPGGVASPANAMAIV